MTAAGRSVLDRVRALLPEKYREGGYRLVAFVTTLLFGLGVINNGEAELWAQLGISTVGCLFALLYSTSLWRSALYTVVGPLGAVLMAYGIVSDVKWAVVTAAAGQLFGIATAAAKTVQRDYTLAA